MSQTPTTPQPSTETTPIVFTFGESINTTSSTTSEPVFVFTAGTRAAQRDAALLTPETTPSVPLNDSLNDSLDGLVLSDVDSSAEQEVESDQEEKVADDTPIRRVAVRRRVIVPSREMRNLRRNFRESMANIASAMTEPLENPPPLPDSDAEDNDEDGTETDVANEEIADNDEAAEDATDDEEEAVTEIAFESDTDDDDDEFAAEIVDNTSLPIQTRLFPTATGEPDCPISSTTEDEDPSCSVCYCDLTVKNCVTALCGHTYCNKCFFRWMETNATCACCRRPFDSKTNLTDEQLDREYDECYIRYQHLLIRHNTALQQSNRLFRENIAIEERTRNMMARHIRVREMIDYARGYNDGCVAAHDKIINGGKGINSKCWKNKSQNSEWASGFHKAYYHEKSEMKRKMRNLDKINKRIQTKRRRVFNFSDDEEEAYA